MLRTSLPSNILEPLIMKIRRAVTAAIMLTLLLATATLLNAQTYTQIKVPGAVETEAHGINAFGQIVGSWQDASGNTHGFLYNAGTFTTIDYPGSEQTTLYAINNAGDIVGDHDASMGFLLKGGVFTTLTNANGWDINNLDLIATGSGFLEPNGIMDPIQFPGSLFTLSWGINDALEIAGTYSDGTRTHGFF